MMNARTSEYTFNMNVTCQPRGFDDLSGEGWTGDEPCLVTMDRPAARWHRGRPSLSGLVTSVDLSVLSAITDELILG
jgi:hypothetical protein